MQVTSERLYLSTRGLLCHFHLFDVRVWPLGDDGYRSGQTRGSTHAASRRQGHGVTEPRVETRDIRNATTFRKSIESKGEPKVS